MIHLPNGHQSQVITNNRPSAVCVWNYFNTRNGRLENTDWVGKRVTSGFRAHSGRNEMKRNGRIEWMDGWDRNFGLLGVLRRSNRGWAKIKYPF